MSQNGGQLKHVFSHIIINKQQKQRKNTDIYFILISLWYHSGKHTIQFRLVLMVYYVIMHEVGHTQLYPLFENHPYIYQCLLQTDAGEAPAYGQPTLGAAKEISLCIYKGSCIQSSETGSRC